MLRHRDKGYSRSIFSRGDQCICSLRLPICWGTSSRVSWRWPWGYCACRKQKWHASKVHWFWLSASFPPQTRSSSIKRPSADFLLTSFLTLTFPQMGATYVTLMKFLVSSTDGFVGGNLHLQDTWVPHMGKEKRSAFVPGSVSPARQPVDPLRPWQAGIQHHP